MNRASGFTLLETTFATLLVSLLLVTSVSSLSMVIQTTSTDREALTAHSIAMTMLAEITSRAFRDPDTGSTALGKDGESSVDRSQWDDSDDYHYWSQANPTHVDGSAWPEANGWKVLSASYNVNASDLTSARAPTDFKQVLVGVTSPAGKNYVVSALEAECGLGSHEVAPGGDRLSSAEIHASREGVSTQLSAVITTDRVKP